MRVVSRLEVVFPLGESHGVDVVARRRDSNIVANRTRGTARHGLSPGEARWRAQEGVKQGAQLSEQTASAYLRVDSVS